MIGSGYAAVCLSLILLVSPVAPREAAVEASSEASLDTALSNYVNHVGLEFLSNATLSEICASVSDASNSTVVLDAVLQGTPCWSVSVPATEVASQSLSVDLPGRALVVEAWLARG